MFPHPSGNWDQAPASNLQPPPLKWGLSTNGFDINKGPQVLVQITMRAPIQHFPHVGKPQFRPTPHGFKGSVECRLAGRALPEFSKMKASYPIIQRSSTSFLVLMLCFRGLCSASSHATTQQPRPSDVLLAFECRVRGKSKWLAQST